MRKIPESVKIVEVSPRDGLQNEPSRLATPVKIDFINRLSQTGLSCIEVTSFVSPEAVPQLADAEQVFSSIKRRKGIKYPVLIPNLQGLERAISVGVEDIAIFTAASETFNQKNIHCSIDKSFSRFQPVINRAIDEGIRIRGYVSCALGCPYEGAIEAGKVAAVATRLFRLGCEEISLGDTIGVGTPLQARRMLETVADSVPLGRLAVHFHDTRGQALANIFACLEAGVRIIDAAVAGLGGCPYVRGATGNVATEDLVYLLHGMGIETGVDLKKLIDAGRFISQALQRHNQSRVVLAVAGNH